MILSFSLVVDETLKDTTNEQFEKLLEKKAQ